MLELGLRLSPRGEGQCSLSEHVQQMTVSMEMYKERWDGIERVVNRMTTLLPYDNSGGNEKIVAFTTAGILETPPVTAVQQSPPTIESVLCENFKNNTAQYLQMITALNICIAKGRHVAVDDLPEQLRAISLTFPVEIGSPAIRFSSTTFDHTRVDFQRFSTMVHS